MGEGASPVLELVPVPAAEAEAQAPL